MSRQIRCATSTIVVVEVIMTKRINKHYPSEFKQEAVVLVIEQDYSIVQAAPSLGVTDKLF